MTIIAHDELLQTTLRPFYTGKPGVISVIETIHVSNDNEDEGFELEIYLVTNDKSKGRLTPKLNLSAGEMWVDDQVYRLTGASMSLWARSDKTTVRVVFTGYEDSNR